MASLPALLASNIKSSSRPRGQDASASTSSQSETSSPLQSPSPFAHPVLGLENSPKEDAFTLPPPAYPHANPLYHNTFSTSSNPVKIPTYKAASPAADLSHSQRESYKEHLNGTPTKGIESTLRYGRRPGHTNSVTSPLALFPIGSTKRHDSNGASRPTNVLGSPAFAPLRNVSDSSVLTTQQNGDNRQRKSFAYGTHSPLLLAANASRAPSSAVDFSNASVNPRDQSPQLQASSSTAALKSAQNGNSERQSRSGSRPRVVVRETAVDNRRKSFPAHLFAGLRPKLTTSATVMDARAQPVICSDSEEDGLVPPPETEREISRRGRSRERKMSAVEREGSRSRSSRAPSSHLGLDGMAQPRTSRSGSRMRRERDGERDRKRSQGRRNRDRSQSSSDRERSSGDDQSFRNHHAAPRLTTRDSHYNPELDTIVGSFQNEQQAGRSVERGRGAKASDVNYDGFREGSPLATIKPNRRQIRPVGPDFSPTASSKVLSDEPVDRRSRSKSTSEFKRTYDARVVV
jgi:hypothetical protein